jgi:hypothetical protein
MADNFRAHDPKLGMKLGRVQELGPPGLARQVRGAFKEAATTGVAFVKDGRVLTDAEVLAPAGPAAAPAAPRGKRGRPRVEGERPWEALGLSRAAWYRKKKKEGGSAT